MKSFVIACMIFVAVSLGARGATAAACGAPTDQVFVFHLSGDQELPPVTTRLGGGCVACFDAGSSTLALTCVHDVTAPTAMHVHRAAAGVAGPPIFTIDDLTSPVEVTWAGMVPADVADLLGGNLYVNIHDAARPNGAVRGQVLPRTVDSVNFTANGAQVVPPTASTAVANCTADLANNAATLSLACTHDLASPDAAHVHTAPRGVAATGAPTFTFASAASPLNENMPVTGLDIANFAAGFLYVEVHGATGADAVRGQIGALPTTRSLGEACAAADECSTPCVDGVCCENACGDGNADDCTACSVAAGSATNGTCAVRADDAICGGGGLCAAGSCVLVPDAGGSDATTPATPDATQEDAGATGTPLRLDAGGGCACRTAPASSSLAAWLAALAVLVGVSRRVRALVGR